MAGSRFALALVAALLTLPARMRMPRTIRRGRSRTSFPLARAAGRCHRAPSGPTLERVQSARVGEDAFEDYGHDDETDHLDDEVPEAAG